MDSKYLHFTVRDGGLICETKLSLQKLELRMQGGGGLMCDGGVITGFYVNIIIILWQLSETGNRCLVPRSKIL